MRKRECNYASGIIDSGDTVRYDSVRYDESEKREREREREKMREWLEGMTLARPHDYECPKFNATAWTNLCTFHNNGL